MKSLYAAHTKRVRSYAPLHNLVLFCMKSLSLYLHLLTYPIIHLNQYGLVDSYLTWEYIIYFLLFKRFQVCSSIALSVCSSAPTIRSRMICYIFCSNT